MKVSLYVFGLPGSTPSRTSTSETGFEGSIDPILHPEQTQRTKVVNALV